MTQMSFGIKPLSVCQNQVRQQKRRNYKINLPSKVSMAQSTTSSPHAHNVQRTTSPQRLTCTLASGETQEYADHSFSLDDECFLKSMTSLPSKLSIVHGQLPCTRLIRLALRAVSAQGCAPRRHHPPAFILPTVLTLKSNWLVLPLNALADIQSGHFPGFVVGGGCRRTVVLCPGSAVISFFPHPTDNALAVMGNNSHSAKKIF